MLYLIFFIIWIIFNGKFSIEVMIFGVIISGIMLWFMCKFMDHSLKKELMYIRLIPLFISFFAVLLWEILKANFSVIKTIVLDEYEVEPEIVHFLMDLDDEFCRVLLANAITLTPGTITVNCINGVFIVHCLDKEMAKGIDSSSFVKIVKKINIIKNKYRKAGERSC